MNNKKSKNLIKVISAFSFGFFAILTLIGIVGVLTHTFSNAGYAVIASIWAIISIVVYRKYK